MENYQPMFLRHQHAITIEIKDGLEVSLDNGLKKFHLNGTAKKVWELAIKPISVDTLVYNITHTYGQPQTQVLDEVLQFLDDATLHGIISQFIAWVIVSPDVSEPRALASGIPLPKARTQDQFIKNDCVLHNLQHQLLIQN